MQAQSSFTLRGGLEASRGDGNVPKNSNAGPRESGPPMATLTTTVNSAPLYRLNEALRVFQEATRTKKQFPEGNAEFQAQLLRVFLFVATRHPTEASLGECEKVLNLSQTAASRNFGYLADGNAKMPEGYKLIEVYVDPFYQRRKLARLTQKGVDVANKIAKVLS